MSKSLLCSADMTRFLRLSRRLPLLDLGANLGLVALQAALQGRQVKINNNDKDKNNEYGNEHKKIDK